MVSQPWQLHCNLVFVATLIAVNKGSGFFKPTVAVILCSSRTAGSCACKLQRAPQQLVVVVVIHYQANSKVALFW